MWFWLGNAVLPAAAAAFVVQVRGFLRSLKVTVTLGLSTTVKTSSVPTTTTRTPRKRPGTDRMIWHGAGFQ